MKTIKGPGIFLVQFVGAAPPSTASTGWRAGCPSMPAPSRASPSASPFQKPDGHSFGPNAWDGHPSKRAPAEANYVGMVDCYKTAIRSLG
jgi:hypothetical protein